VEAAGIAAVVARKDPPLRIDLNAECVAAALGEDFIEMAPGMVWSSEACLL
jgi:hypothetical protein